METETQQPPPIIEDEDEGDGFVIDDGAAPEAIPQVSSYIAIIRIIAVLGMGLCISFGLFMMLVGLKGVVIGVPIALLAIPLYFAMQWAERLALRRESS